MAPPVSPRVRRGMLLRLRAPQAADWGLAFPLNPSSLHRTLIAADSGPAQETIALTLRLDATDALAELDHVGTQVGLHPQLAVLERLLRPPTDGGVTLFAWGARAVPVTVTELAVHETLFDPSLNPLRADVEVALRVVTEGRQQAAAATWLQAHERWHEHMAAQVAAPDHRLDPPDA